MQETAIHTTFSEPVMPQDPEIEAMVKAGVHLGHTKSKNHPSMQAYIFGVRNTISIIDVVKTKEKLAAVLDFLRGITARGGMVLFVGTRPSAHEAVLDTAKKTDMPYFIERWIGGTLTNFKVIRHRVEYLEELEHGQATGAFEKYTKKERLMKQEEIDRLKKNFDGIRLLKRLPDAVFVVDTTEDTTAVAEARVMGIPVVALADTNANIGKIDFPIPSNDSAVPAVEYMMGRITDAIIEGQRQASKVEETKE